MPDKYLPYLPKPLPNDELKKILEECSKGSKEALELLIVHNIRLVVHEISKKFNTFNYDQNDLFQVGAIGLIKAAKTFNISKGINFSTYAVRCIDNEILMFIRKIKSIPTMQSLDTPLYLEGNSKNAKIDSIIDTEMDFVNDYENKEIYSYIRYFITTLKERDQKIITMYFGFNNNEIYSQNEIANILHISRSNVSKIIQINLKKLKESLEQKEFFESKNTMKRLK